MRRIASSRASWIHSIYTKDEFQQRYSACHPLFEFPGMLPQTVAIDLLHVCDHNGVAGSVAGSIMYEAIREKELGNSSLESGVQILSEKIKEYYTTSGVQSHLPRLTLQNLIDTLNPLNSFPDLRGKAIKAANTRNIMPFVEMLAAELRDGSEYKDRRHKCVQSLVRFYDTVYDSGIYMSIDQSEAMASAIKRCCKHYTWLAKRSTHLGLMRWPIRPKMHYWYHLTLRKQFLNPRFLQTYANESMVGKTCNIYKSALSGSQNERRKVQHSVLAKYLTGLMVTFAGNASSD